MAIQHSTFTAPQELRAEIRAGRYTGPTAGQAPGYVQANLVLLPAEFADEFEEFCRLNPKPCPLLERTRQGDPCPVTMAPDADLRTDVPRYRIFRHGVLQADEPTEIVAEWRDDLVGFLLGCSFTFEHALERAGLRVRHIELGGNVPMYRTTIPCRPAGRFTGPLVVSMRPYPREQIDQVFEITRRYGDMHGEPVHIGDPAKLGIGDLDSPDYGEAVPIRSGEVPMFWACGVTPQAAILAARPDLAITHSPGCMFVTDVRENNREMESGA